MSRLRLRACSQSISSTNAVGALCLDAITTLGYDAQGNETSVNAPLGRNTTQAYDSLNRLAQVTDPASGVTQYGYNALDQLISVTDPRSKVTSYSYNAFDDVTQLVSPDTRTTTSTYDSAGNLKTKTDARGALVTYSYDALNRATQAVWSDQTIQYTYDQGANGLGRLSSVSDNSGQTSWTYDSQGRPVSRQQVMGSVSLGASVSYDSAGRPSIVSYPSGHYIQYGYANGKVASITLDGSASVLTGVLYEPFGPVSGWTWGNSTLAVHGRDLDGKIDYIDSAGLRTYNYDDAFRITDITDASNSSLSQSYSYDLLDRLTGATGSTLNQSWTYDPNGNRLTQGGSSSSTYSIASSSNRLTSVTGALTRSYSYDSAGNTLSDGTTNFTYDQAGRMVSASKAGITAAYSLNALGQRVRKTVAGVSTYFFYDESGRLMGEYDSGGALIQEIVWLGDTPVASVRPNAGGSGVGVFYIHTDHLGAPIKLTRPSDNAIVWRWDHDPFGNGVPDEDPDGNSQLVQFNLRFPGQYFDAETGLSYNYFRDYDPATGRYVQSDPIGLLGGINTYGYADGNPLTYYDPYGLYSFDEFIGDAANYSAGFGDTLSFGLTEYIRDQWDIGSVDKCSKGYRYGAYTEIGVEVGLTGASYILRKGARSITQAAARRGQPYHGTKGRTEVHHKNPLKEGLFPTASLPRDVRHHPWNLKELTLPDHRAAHRALARHELYGKILVNPPTTAGRAVKRYAEECGCQ